MSFLPCRDQGHGADNPFNPHNILRDLGALRTHSLNKPDHHSLDSNPRNFEEEDEVRIVRLVEVRLIIDLSLVVSLFSQTEKFRVSWHN